MLDFPAPPLVNGATYVAPNGVIYEWLSPPNIWVSLTAAGATTGTGPVVLQNSPVLTGNPTSTTPPLGDNDSSIATTEFVNAALATSGGGPPSGDAGGDLDGEYPNPTLVGGPLSNYLPLTGGTLTGDLFINDPATTGEVTVGKEGYVMVTGPTTSEVDLVMLSGAVDAKNWAITNSAPGLSINAASDAWGSLKTWLFARDGTTTLPGALALNVASAATTFVGLTLNDTTSSSAWVVNQPNVGINFTTADASGLGAGVRFRFGMSMDAANGSLSSLVWQAAQTTIGNNVTVMMLTSGGTLSTTGGISTTTGTFSGAVSMAALTASALTANAGDITADRTGDAAAASFTARSDNAFNAGTIYTMGATSRWFIGKNADPESTGNAGGNFLIYAYADNGAALGNALSIARATRIVTFGAAIAGTAGTFSGNVTAATLNATGAIGAGSSIVIDNAAGVAQLYLSSPVNTQARILFTTSGVARWFIEKGVGTEPGGNVGADLAITARDDAGGNTIGNALVLTRATMLATFGGTVALPNGNLVIGTTPLPSPAGASKFWTNAEMVMLGTSRAITGNLYFETTWKYGTAGAGGGIRFGASATDAVSILTAATGTAGAAATVAQAMVFDPSTITITTASNWIFNMTGASSSFSAGTVTGSTVNASGGFAAKSSVAVTAAALSQNFIRAATGLTLGLYYGTGVPAFAATSGSMYIRTDGAANTRWYVNTTGSTTWAAVTTP